MTGVLSHREGMPFSALGFSSRRRITTIFTGATSYLSRPQSRRNARFRWRYSRCTTSDSVLERTAPERRANVQVAYSGRPE